MLRFETETGFIVDPVETVREQIAAAWKNALYDESTGAELATDPETPIGQLIDSETASIAETDSELLYIANQFDPAVNSGVFQDAIARIYFLERKEAIPSTARVLCSGLPGTVIKSGALLRSSVDSTLWACTDAATIGTDGTIYANFACQTTGAISAPAGSMQIVTLIAGWDSAENETASVGSPAETRSQFEARRYASVAVNSRSTASAIYARVMAVDNVISCYVTQNRTNTAKTVDGYTLPPHSVYVAVVGGADADIARALYDTVSAGCDWAGSSVAETVQDENTAATEVVKFQRPTALSIYIKVQIENFSGLTESEIENAKTAIFNNFYGLDESITLNGSPIPRVVMSSIIYASRFPVSLYNLGINQIKDVLISTDGSNWVRELKVKITEDPELLTSNITLE